MRWRRSRVALARWPRNRPPRPRRPRVRPRARGPRRRAVPRRRSGSTGAPPGGRRERWLPARASASGGPSGPAGSGRPARGAGGQPGARAGPDPLRADAGLAVHVLPRRRRVMAADLGDDPAHRASGPAVRRRAPVELRRVRRSRARPRLRPQRLRRDVARAVGVGRQAAGGQLRGRRPRARGFDARARRRSTLARSRAYREAMRDFAGDARRSTSGTRAWTSTTIWKAVGEQLTPIRCGASSRNVAKARSKDSLQRVRQARPTWRRAAAASSATRRWSCRWRSSFPRGRAARRGALRDLLRAYRADAAARPAAPAGSVTGTSTRRARSSAWAAWGRAPGSCCCSAARTSDPLFLQAKEAQASVLEPFLGTSGYETRGGESSRASA